jgi:putative ubiquitin-RnfH superfamily antitoxin RatB of RatAB toxin-antitoxin module
MIRIEVVYALPGEQALVTLELPEGASVGQAVERSGLLARFPEIDPRRVKTGIFGKVAAAGTTLEDGDRVEIYRPLRADPREARRTRAGPRRAR